jgi:mono/diheme cytochrome c family protein
VAVGNVASGLAKYTANCSGCHGQGKASDTKVNTATKLASVMNSVGSHAGLRSTLTEQDRLDIAAYVASPK